MGLAQCFRGGVRFLLEGVGGVTLLGVLFGLVFRWVLGWGFIGEMLARRGDGF